MGSFWKMHESRVSGAAVNYGSDIGTIAGRQTVPELEDLIKIQDYRIVQTKAAYDANAPTILIKDPTWISDWVAMQNRYDTSRLRASMAIQLAPPIGRSYIPVQAEYDQMMRAVQQVPFAMTKGDLSDLMTRVRKAGFAVDESQTPQPRQNVDVDQSVLAAIPPPPQLTKKDETGLIVGGAILAVGTLGILIIAARR